MFRPDQLATMTMRQPERRRHLDCPLNATRAETVRNQAIHQRARPSVTQRGVASQEERSRRRRAARAWQRLEGCLSQLQRDPPAAPKKAAQDDTAQIESAKAAANATEHILRRSDRSLIYADLRNRKRRQPI
jgi:hypothetical protein